MPHAITRRNLVGLMAAAVQNPVRPEPDRGARQDLGLVASFVALAHKDQNLDRVAEMLTRNPKLIYASWDWGGGDWETGLGGASHVGSRKMARMLLEKGARIDAYCAAMLGHRALVAELVAAQPDVVNARGPHGYSLLYHAAISGDVKIAELLDPHLANRPRDCNQALSAAVRDGNLEMTSWLLNHGVTDPNQEDALGRRPLALAMSSGFTEVADQLRQHGAR